MRFCEALLPAPLSPADMLDLVGAFERLLDDVMPAPAVRKIEACGSTDDAWNKIEESGFLDALVPEQSGGAGLTLAEVGLLAFAAGQRALPLPFSDTVVARAILRAAAHAVPRGRVVLATPIVRPGAIVAQLVPLGLVADAVLLDCGDRLVLSALKDATRTPVGVHGSLCADFSWSSLPRGVDLPRIKSGLRPVAATLRAAEIAGACDRLLQMTVEYASTRKQFGKPIGRQQAIEQQLAIMAEQVVMARMAAQIGCASSFPPAAAAAAVAKQITSTAAVKVAEIAHLVHGAVGISEESDVQLYTRRLQEWRFADGSEGYWAAKLGRARLSSGSETTLGFVLERLEPVAQQTSP